MEGVDGWEGVEGVEDGVEGVDSGVDGVGSVVEVVDSGSDAVLGESVSMASTLEPPFPSFR